ncbi:UNVERIFIED_CONTAM: hypothetical protein K2H54_051122 [Gekko kuhli]
MCLCSSRQLKVKKKKKTTTNLHGTNSFWPFSDKHMICMPKIPFSLSQVSQDWDRMLSFSAEELCTLFASDFSLASIPHFALLLFHFPCCCCPLGYLGLM